MLPVYMQSFACRRSIRPSLDPLIEDNEDEDFNDDDEEMDAGPMYGVSRERLRRLETLDSVSPAPGSSLGGMSTDNSCRLYGTSTAPLRNSAIAHMVLEQGYGSGAQSPCDAPLIREDTWSVSSKNTDGQMTAPVIASQRVEDAQDTACSDHAVSAAQPGSSESPLPACGDAAAPLQLQASPAPVRQVLAEIDGGINIEHLSNPQQESRSSDPQTSNHTTGGGRSSIPCSPVSVLVWGATTAAGAA